MKELTYTLQQYSNSYLNYIYYKYPIDTESITNLLLISKANTQCLSPKQISKYNQLIDLVSLECFTIPNYIKVVKDNQLSWDMSNPQCTSRKRWEKLVLGICTKYNINIEITKSDTISDKNCNLALDITKNIINCDILTGISLHKQVCNLGIKIEKSIGECYHSHKLLIEKYPECNITLKEYHKMINKNISHTLIEQIYSNNLKLSIDVDEDIKLQTLFDTYSIPNDIDTQALLLSSDCTILTNFLQDYNLPAGVVQKILNGKITI